MVIHPHPPHLLVDSIDLANIFLSIWLWLSLVAFRLVDFFSEFFLWGPMGSQIRHLWPRWPSSNVLACLNLNLTQGHPCLIHMGEISQGGYFPQILSLFLQIRQLFSSTFCIDSIVLIISTGQSHVPESGKPSFWPGTSGKVLEKNSKHGRLWGF